MERGLRVTGVVMAALLATSCATAGAFRADDRVEILAPAHAERVSLPVELRWSVEDFEVTGSSDSVDDRSGYFAVFVDRTPLAPGTDLASVAEHDEACLGRPDCPDDDYFQLRGIHRTAGTALTLTHADLRDERSRPGANDWHEATIVLVDGRGARIGESAWTVRFIVERES